MRVFSLRFALVSSALVLLLLSTSLAMILWIVADALLLDVALVGAVVSSLGLYFVFLFGGAVFVLMRTGMVRTTVGPPLPLLLGLFVLVLLFGQIALDESEPVLGAIALMLGAALPPSFALAVGLRRLQTGIRERTLLAAVLVGSILSVSLAVAIEVALPSVVAAFVLPLRDVLSDLLRSPSLEDLFFSRGLVVVMVTTAIVAPLAEEGTKPLAVLVLHRWIGGRREAFLVGMAGGLGFAVLENLLYEGIWSGNEWFALTAVRGIGGALHPLGAGVVGLALYDLRRGDGDWMRLAQAYALAVGLHMAWNSGLVMLYSTLGDRAVSGAPTVALSGIEEFAIVIAWLVLMAALIWRLLFVVTARLQQPSDDRLVPVATLGLDQPRRLALTATAMLGAAVVSGELWGPVLARQLERVMG